MTTALPDRLRALGEAVQAGEAYLDSAVLDGTSRVRARATERLTLGGEHTVVALAGATGSGKSSLFNALAGAEVAAVGVRRPTTGSTQACVWPAQGQPDPDPLLDWLGVPRRHRLGAAGPDGARPAALDGLVLLDLPDHDSVRLDHRVEVDRLVRVVDLLVWVLDPQKYADAAVHERYLAPLSSHAEVTVVVLSQVDRLGAGDRERCLQDLRGLLVADGLADVPVLPVSAVTGEGVADLRTLLADRVAGRRVALARLQADVSAAAAELGGYCGAAAPDPAAAGQHAELVPALSAAAGVPTVVRAVDSAHRRQAAVATGWPPVRWVGRLRPDPLRRLRLTGGPTPGAGRSSLPAPSPADRSRVAVSVRRFSDEASDGLPPPWPGQVRAAALAAEAELPDVLDRTVSSTDLGATGRPRWWRLAAGLQAVLLAVTLAGLLWLLGLAAWSYLQLGSAPVPHVGRAPVPTLLLVAGVVGGLLTALVGRRLAALGARRRARRARRRLEDEIARAAQLTVIAAVAEVLAAYARFCGAVERAAGPAGPSSGRGRRGRAEAAQTSAIPSR